MSKRQNKVNSLIRQLAASFTSKELGGAIITITRVETSKDLKSAKILVSIFPENKEVEVFKVLKEKTNELYKYIGSRIRMKFLPHLEFEIDRGEKSRMEIEKILGQAR